MHVQPDRSFHKTFQQWNYCNLIFNLIFQKKKKKKIKGSFQKKISVSKNIEWWHFVFYLWLALNTCFRSAQSLIRLCLIPITQADNQGNVLWLQWRYFRQFDRCREKICKQLSFVAAFKQRGKQYLYRGAETKHHLFANDRRRTRLLKIRTIRDLNKQITLPLLSLIVQGKVEE